MDTTLTDGQWRTLDALAADGDDGAVNVVGWSEKHRGPIVYNVRYGTRAAITPTGTYRRVA